VGHDGALCCFLLYEFLFFDFLIDLVFNILYWCFFFFFSFNKKKKFKKKKKNFLPCASKKKNNTKWAAMIPQVFPTPA